MCRLFFYILTCMPHHFVDVDHASAAYRTAYDQEVLHDISFHAHTGDHVVLFGASGSGKSSFIKMLCGDLSLISGSASVNGKPVGEEESVRSGYVSLERTDDSKKTVYDSLIDFGELYTISHLPARIGEVLELLEIKSLATTPVDRLSTTQHIAYQVARASLSDSPILLLDDVLDTLGVEETRKFLDVAAQGRTVIVTTRTPLYAEQIGLPLLLLHNGSLAHAGTREDIAKSAGVPRIVDAWVEGLRYDMLRKLREHTGVLEVRILPTDRFQGNLVRVVIRNARFMPSLYDLMSQTELVHVEEVPPSLTDIIESL